MRKKGILALAVMVAMVSSASLAQSVSTRQIGQAGLYQGAVGMAEAGGKLYVAVRNGSGTSLVEVDVNSGSAVDKGKIHNVKYLVGSDNVLFGLDPGDLMKQIEPAGMKASDIGPPGAWKNTIAIVSMNGNIYTIEDDGGMRAIYPSAGKREALGKFDKEDVGILFTCGGQICMIEKGGAFYTVDIGSGKRKRSGFTSKWKNTVDAAGVSSMIYAVEDNGDLYSADSGGGDRKKIGEGTLPNPEFLAGVQGRLFGLDTSGTLYEIMVR